MLRHCGKLLRLSQHQLAFIRLFSGMHLMFFTKETLIAYNKICITSTSTTEQKSTVLLESTVPVRILSVPTLLVMTVGTQMPEVD